MSYYSFSSSCAGFVLASSSAASASASAFAIFSSSSCLSNSSRISMNFFSFILSFISSSLFRLSAATRSISAYFLASSANSSYSRRQSSSSSYFSLSLIRRLSDKFLWYALISRFFRRFSSAESHSRSALRAELNLLTSFWPSCGFYTACFVCSSRSSHAVSFFLKRISLSRCAY